jgi:hypothetical protein
MAIGLVQRLLQAQDGVHAGGKGYVTARRLGRNVSEGFDSVHGGDYTLQTLAYRQFLH